MTHEARLNDEDAIASEEHTSGVMSRYTAEVNGGMSKWESVAKHVSDTRNGSAPTYLSGTTYCDTKLLNTTIE